MANPTVIVYPTKDLEGAKARFAALLGVDPYVDSPYYVGYKAGESEIGLDPNGASSGPIVYWDTDDIEARVSELASAGWEITSNAKNVGGGLLVAQLSDESGNVVGFRQQPK